VQTAFVNSGILERALRALGRLNRILYQRIAGRALV
jgi:hypothetical protein